MDTNKIEKVLLDRELKKISDKLANIGEQIKGVFQKYGALKGHHEKELHDYIVKMVLRVGRTGIAGYTTEPQAITHPDHIPECVKELVLTWAVDDFFGRFQDIEDIINGIE